MRTFDRRISALAVLPKGRLAIALGGIDVQVYASATAAEPEIVFGGTVTRCNVETGKTENVSPEVDLPTPARHTWTVPLVFSKADPTALYFSDQPHAKVKTLIESKEVRVRVGRDPNSKEPMCNVALGKALQDLRGYARTKNANAVVNVTTRFQGKEISSSTRPR